MVKLLVAGPVWQRVSGLRAATTFKQRGRTALHGSALRQDQLQSRYITSLAPITMAENLSHKRARELETVEMLGDTDGPQDRVRCAAIVG
ncbi:hypothetical protein ElyMa_001159100 [Elysia marginata]|uniref:Uncharacterized protein n=1 Tax=Elysia marginata TaxID=1093978 RepID=A0AAV4I499_9GAST|nr:hypothetical protein ElyMa_001159100 [Elysia marginata]